MHLINYFVNISARKMLLFDGIGALLTAIMCQVVAHFETVLGMSERVMSILTGVALCFAMFSFTGYISEHIDFRKRLRIIMVANICYSISILALTVIYVDRLTVIGIAYFAGEILIISSVSYLEYRKTQ